MMQQQQMAEQNQTNQQTMAQQMPQQMVLCPVRVVYETQILMQPDQMQPNQTFFINPQNQPPWAHNRQMPNQVFYVQHPGNNIMSSMPQHMEQSHFYVQQPYQQIVQHPMFNAQNQENIMRSYQMPNVMSTNMIQNGQNNIGANFQSQMSQHNDPTPNYGIIHSNIGSNTPVTQTNTMPVDRQEMIMQGNQNQNVTNQKQMYINVGQQSNQQGMVRSQLTLNPMQQPSSSAQIFDQTSQVQNITTNTPQLPQVIPRTFVSKASTQPVRMRTVTLNSVTPANIRTIDQNYACRPIKPRPEYRPNISSYPNTQIQVPQVINTVNVNSTLYNKVPNQSATAVSNNDTIKVNRKRKSESPDALNPKFTVVNVNNTITQPPINNHVKSIDVGINTSPIHKPVNYSLQKTNNNDTMNRIIVKAIPQDLKSEDHKTVDTPKIKQEVTENKPVINTKDVKQDDNTKTVRYTVFPQARVRATEEVKPNVFHILKDNKNIINADDKKVEPKAENSKTLLKEKILSKNDEKNSKVNETLLTGVNANVMTKDGNEKGKEFVLTHVLDGLVIQESNIAFPIRDTTKKTTQTETKSSDKKPEVIKVDDLLKNNCLELPISDRSLQEKVNEDKDKKEDSDNPFANIKASTVKSWTIDQLTSHLSKYKWEETISLLQDHEIDGESLFLVTKSQLMQIGIKENHADIICEYAKR